MIVRLQHYAHNVFEPASGTARSKHDRQGMDLADNFELFAICLSDEGVVINAGELTVAFKLLGWYVCRDLDSNIEVAQVGLETVDFQLEYRYFLLLLCVIVLLLVCLLRVWSVDVLVSVYRPCGSW